VTTRPSYLDDIVTIAQIPAPTFSEEARIDWVEDRLSGARGERRRDAVGNLLWTWGEGPPALLLTAHVDTVFDADTPLDIRIDGPDLRGPGVGDNATAVAMVIDVVEAVLAETELAPGGVAFTVGEEGLGNLRGAAAACESLKPRAVIALEGHGLGNVVVDAVGSLRAKVVVRGPGGHSWVDRGRPSAIHALAEVAVGLVRRGAPEAPVNIGVIGGGRTANTISEEAHLLFEVRALDAAVLDAWAAELSALTVPSPLHASVESVSRRPAGRLARDADLLFEVRRARAELGLPQMFDSGSTDANAALALGIPALAIGIADGTGMHTVAEQINIASLALGRRQLRLIVERMLARERAPV
jgi:tripeptide aminopeptidase